MTSFISKKSLLFLASLLFFGAILTALPSPKASALSGGEFQAGRIMDDGVFFNPNNMSVQQIQEFLNAKVPVCDTNGTQMHSSGMTRAAYGASKGYPAPFICLKDYRQDTTNKSAEAGLCNGHTAGNKSAAQIIGEVANSCGVSPKVLLVLLQKEQSLVTDDWPWSVQYRSATGYGCPDTAPCDAEYYGFFNQVYAAARQFKVYAKNPASYNYRSLRDNFILYNPNTACGGSNIYIQNQATAGLYVYTPYQPNQAALNNLYGSGDGCSAYGNRNFWRMFNDWFGSTHVPNYSWQPVGQYAYTDETKTTGKATTNLLPGDRVYVGFQARNTGNVTWQRDGAEAIKVGTINPLDRHSSFCDPSWGYGCNRPATMKEASVAPGQIGTFEFWMKARDIGTHPERFTLIIDGQSWFPDMGLQFYSTVTPPTYSWQFVNQYAYTDETKTTGKGTNGLLPGDRIYVGFQARNTGNVTWQRDGANPIHVGMTQPTDRSSPAYDATWMGTNRPAKMKEASVAPGQIGTFEFWMKAPRNTGNYLEYYSLVAEGATWMNDPKMNFSMTIDQPHYTWQLVNQYAYTDETKTTGKGTTNLNSGDRVYVGFQARNTGNVTWKRDGANPVNVGMTHPTDRLSSYFDGSWLGQNRPTRLVEASVAPGQIGTFEFWMKAPPNKPGVSLEYFSLVSEGAAWFVDPQLNFYMSAK
ncbi:MAG: hypothetical protein JWL85_414 [Candidatus Saccharibacteria bacterium]|nr:hypothetical protein [Candidatus Saccharibacteria bacterium]